MSVTVSVGNAVIVALSDLERAWPSGAVYPEIGDDLWSPYRDLLDADGNVLLNFGCYAIRADGHTMLVDTGYGPEHGGHLMDELAGAGIAPESIDALVFTHLHGDHIGWNVIWSDGPPRPRFPNARYLVPEGDWRHYAALAEPGLTFEAQVRALEQLGVMDLVGGDHVISPSVTTVATPGHTPGHLSVAVTSGGERGFILGDAAISPVDAQEPDWPNRFDSDPEQARLTRRAVLDRLEREGTLVGASHFPSPGLGRFVQAHGRRVWQPI